jgi:hypothetical protein
MRAPCPLMPSEDDPAIMDAVAPTADEYGGTYKTPSK